MISLFRLLIEQNATPPKQKTHLYLSTVREEHLEQGYIHQSRRAQLEIPNFKRKWNIYLLTHVTVAHWQYFHKISIHFVAPQQMNYQILMTDLEVSGSE